MKKIKPPIKALAAMLGPQKIVEDTEYRLTRHCISVPCEDGTLLFHTLTEALYLLENNEMAEDHFEELLKERFYVPVDFNEEKLAEDVTSLMNKMNRKSSTVTSFTILTTTDCNARCYYCYEIGRKRIPMSDQIARDTAEYIKRKCRGREVSLHWFGGEPLYNRRVIEIITDELRKQQLPFHSRMITNGYYLDKDTCREASEKWNLKKIQITLDGTKEIYQKTKAYIEHDPDAFDRVLDNIDHALDHGIYVSIRLNMDRSNADNMQNLVDLLADRYGNRQNFSVYAALLKSFVGKIVAFDDDMRELDAYKALLKKLREAGISSIRPMDEGIHINHCMADSDSSEVILPDGRIGKCEHHSEENLIGSIYSEERDIDMIRAWKEVMPKYPECSGCPLYPRCRQLVKCDYTEGRCRDTDRMLKEYMLENQILDEYRKYKKIELI